MMKSYRSLHPPSWYRMSDKELEEVQKNWDEEERRPKEEKQHEIAWQGYLKVARNQRCPVISIASEITYNCIGIPRTNIIFYNTTKRIVEALEIDFACYDSFNRRLGRYTYGGVRFKGIVQNLWIEPKTKTQKLMWTLHGYENTTYIKNITILQIKFKDGYIWKRGNHYRKLK